jgi:hypothetical protein
VGRWDQNGSSGDWLGGGGLDSTGTGQGPVAGCCECGDEPSGSCATDLFSYSFTYNFHPIVSGPNLFNVGFADSVVKNLLYK